MTSSIYRLAAVIMLATTLATTGCGTKKEEGAKSPGAGGEAAQDNAGSARKKNDSTSDTVARTAQDDGHEHKDGTTHKEGDEHKDGTTHKEGDGHAHEQSDKK